jgi:hypothetical protein
MKLSRENRPFVLVAVVVIVIVAWTKWQDSRSVRRSGLSEFDPLVCEHLEGECKRGYEWAQGRELRIGSDCPTGVSKGFYQGCLAAVNDTLADLAPD